MPRGHGRSICSATKKKGYRDKVAADLALLDIERNQRRLMYELKRSYRCGLCGKWHLTSQEPDPSRVLRSA